MNPIDVNIFDLFKPLSPLNLLLSGNSTLPQLKIMTIEKAKKKKRLF